MKKILPSPTCTEEGSIEHWKCPECGKLFTDSHGRRQTMRPIGNGNSCRCSLPEDRRGKVPEQQGASENTTAGCRSRKTIDYIKKGKRETELFFFDD